MSDLIRIWESDCHDWASGPPDPLEEGYIASGPPSPCPFVPPEILETVGIDLVTVPPCSTLRMMQVPVLTSFQTPVATPAPPPPPPAPPASPAAPPPPPPPPPAGGGGMPDDPFATGPSGPTGPTGPPEGGCGEPSTLRVLTDITCTMYQDPLIPGKFMLRLTKVFKTVVVCLVEDGSSSEAQEIEESDCETTIPCTCPEATTGPL